MYGGATVRTERKQVCLNRLSIVNALRLIKQNEMRAISEQKAVIHDAPASLFLFSCGVFLARVAFLLPERPRPLSWPYGH